MPNTKEIRRRIRAVKNIEKITNAMKMVAAARLRKVQEQAVATRPYAEKMREVVGSLAASSGEITHPLLQERPIKKVAFVIIGADRGLAGSFNNNVMNKALAEIRKHDEKDVKLVVVGNKAISFFQKRPYQVAMTLDLPPSGVDFASVKDVTDVARIMFEEYEADAVYLIYAKFITAMTQIPEVVRMLPMAPPVAAEEVIAEFEFEPSAKTLLEALLPRYLNTQVYQAFVESQASEHGARMSAMTAATKNAAEVIDTLTLQYNKARQAAITTELSEIVSGADALE